MFLVPNSILLCLYDLSARSMKYDFFFYTGIGYIIFTAFFLFIYEYISVPYRSKDFAFAEFCYDCQFFASQDTRVQNRLNLILSSFSELLPFPEYAFTIKSSNYHTGGDKTNFSLSKWPISMICACLVLSRIRKQDFPT